MADDCGKGNERLEQKRQRYERLNRFPESEFDKYRSKSAGCSIQSARGRGRLFVFSAFRVHGALSVLHFSCFMHTLSSPFENIFPSVGGTMWERGSAIGHADFARFDVCNFLSNCNSTEGEITVPRWRIPPIHPTRRIPDLSRLPRDGQPVVVRRFRARQHALPPRRHQLRSRVATPTRRRAPHHGRGRRVETVRAFPR